MKADFFDELRERVLVADGGVGSLFCARGESASSCFEGFNLYRPEMVCGVHGEYLDAGARLIETNTFGANRLKLEAHGMEEKTMEINRKGAELAKATAGEKAWVAGSMGPLALGSKDGCSENDKRLFFQEQAMALAEGGVDLLLLETFSSMEELLLALSSVKGACDLPVMAQVVFDRNGFTMDSESVGRALTSLYEGGADVVGSNCGMGPGDYARIFGETPRQIPVPVSAFPNAGFPEKVGDRLMFMADPDYYAEKARLLAEVGVNIIGGCCGTTPAHVKALSGSLKNVSPAKKTFPVKPVETIEVKSRKPPASPLVKPGKNKKIIVELDPPKHMDPASVLAGAEKLVRAGVDYISIAENPLGVPRMSSITLAGMIRRKTGAETIIHMTGRDRNLIGIQSTLMGLAADGFQNILAITGDPPASEGDGAMKGVFHVGSAGLIGQIDRLNRGVPGPFGRTCRAGFNIGAAFNPNSRNVDLQVRRMEKKIEKGARFFMTQPVYSLESVDLVAEKTAHLGVPVYLGILPLVSSRNAEFLHQEFPGITIPEEIRSRMKIAGKEGAAEGAKVAYEIMSHAWCKFPGLYIMPPFNRVDMVTRLVEKIRRLGD